MLFSICGTISPVFHVKPWLICNYGWPVKFYFARMWTDETWNILYSIIHKQYHSYNTVWDSLQFARASRASFGEREQQLQVWVRLM